MWSTTSSCSIVGVPSGVKDYLSRTWTTVANRIAEISEVSSLAKDEVGEACLKKALSIFSVLCFKTTLRRNGRSMCFAS